MRLTSLFAFASACILCSCALIVDNVTDSRVAVAPLPYSTSVISPVVTQPPLPPPVDTPPKHPPAATAVWELTPLAGVPADSVEALTETLRAALLKTGRFSIIARGEMEKVLRGQDVALSAACDTTDCAVEYGQLLSVEKIVVGSVARIGNTHQVVLKLVAVGDGRVERVGTQRGPGGDEVLFELVDLAAKDLSSSP